MRGENFAQIVNGNVVEESFFAGAEGGSWNQNFIARAVIFFERADNVAAGEQAGNVDGTSKKIVDDGQNAGVEIFIWNFGGEIFENAGDRRTADDVDGDFFVGGGGLSGVKFVDKIAGHADTVFDLREAVVVSGGRDVVTCEEIKFVAEVDESFAGLRAGLSLEFFNLRDNFFSAGFIELREREFIAAVLGDADWDDCQTLSERAALENFGNGEVEFGAVVEVRAEDNLGMIFDAAALEFVELFGDIGGARRAEEFSADGGIHGLNGNVQRRQVEIFNAAEIGVGKVCERDKIAVQKTQAVVVVLDGKSAAHIRRNHVDEAEDAVVFAGFNFVDGGLKFGAEFLVEVFFKGDEFAVAALVFDEQFNIFVGEQETQVDKVARGGAVDFEDIVAGGEFEFSGEAVWEDF